MAQLDERVAIRACCISQVLGTDMKKHFDITSRFQVRGSTTELQHNIAINFKHTAHTFDHAHR